ncbi:MAG: response regulator [Planctomycetes bacterium]|nr:response regulator [Planctomycetota bacterium]
MTTRAGSASGARILAVDDNGDMLLAIRRILEREDYRVSTARDGEEALARVREERPDVVLLDLLLPRLDGLEACRLIKADPHTREVMVLIVSCRGTPEARVRGFDAGADDYITKPFHVSEFLARIRVALRIKRLREELRARTRELFASQRALLQHEKLATVGLLAAGIAHEFNNIMAGISGFAQMAKRNPAHRDTLVEVALAQAKRAQEITTSLSTFARPRDRIQPVALPGVVEGAVRLLDKEMRTRRIRCDIRVEADLPRVAGTEGHIQQVFVNLLMNACHAIDREGEIAIEIRAVEDRVVASVRDSGCGIPEAMIGRIFDPFFTTKGALGGGTNPGTGLGLTVTYNVLQALGGRIDVESVEGRGTTFRVALPIALEGGVPANEASAPCDPVPSGRRILVVEDDPTIRDLLREFLADNDVVFAREGAEARRLAAEDRFDAAVVDIDPTGADGGLRAAEEIRRAAPAMRIITLSSALPPPGARQRAGIPGGHLLKPFALEDLLRFLWADPPAEAGPGPS